MPLKKRNVRKKWIFPSRSSIIRPNILGNQKVIAAKIPNVLPPKRT